MWWRPKEPSRTYSEIRLVHKPHALHVPFQGYTRLEGNTVRRSLTPYSSAP